MYEARRVIRDNPKRFPGIFISEDLTKATGELAYKARELRRKGHISKTYTRDCKVVVKRFDGDPPKIVYNEAELLDSAALKGTFAQVLAGPPGGQRPRSQQGPAPSGSLPGSPSRPQGQPGAASNAQPSNGQVQQPGAAPAVQPSNGQVPPVPNPQQTPTPSPPIIDPNDHDSTTNDSVPLIQLASTPIPNTLNMDPAFLDDPDLTTEYY